MHCCKSLKMNRHQGLTLGVWHPLFGYWASARILTTWKLIEIVVGIHDKVFETIWYWPNHKKRSIMGPKCKKNYIFQNIVQTIFFKISNELQKCLFISRSCTRDKRFNVCIICVKHVCMCIWLVLLRMRIYICTVSYS